MRFSWGVRVRARKAFDELSSASAVGRRSADRAADHHPPDQSAVIQTVQWAAMMFLLAANRMSRGYARLRQWLIMAFRMLAIAGLVFAVSRPLAGGWLGLAGGGRADTTIILLDRSPSMQQSGSGVGESKLETARRQLVRTLETLGSNRWILIESATNKPRELESPSALLSAPGAEPVSASSDIPAMLQAARDYIRANKSGRTEIWICSDIRENDWNSESGRWQTLRDAFLEFSQGVRFHLLAYSQPGAGNLSVRVTEVRRQKAGDAAELLVSLRLVREGGGDAKESVPVQFEIEGARSELTVEMAGPNDRRTTGCRSNAAGSGRKVSIPRMRIQPTTIMVHIRPARWAVIVTKSAVRRPLEASQTLDPGGSAEIVAAEWRCQWKDAALLAGPSPHDAQTCVPSWTGAKRFSSSGSGDGELSASADLKKGKSSPWRTGGGQTCSRIPRASALPVATSKSAAIAGLGYSAAASRWCPFVRSTRPVDLLVNDNARHVRSDTGDMAWCCTSAQRALAAGVRLETLASLWPGSLRRMTPPG